MWTTKCRAGACPAGQTHYISACDVAAAYPEGEAASPRRTELHYSEIFAVNCSDYDKDYDKEVAREGKIGVYEYVYE